MICPFCKQINDPDAECCEECGKPLPQAGAGEAQAQAQAQPCEEHAVENSPQDKAETRFPERERVSVPPASSVQPTPSVQPTSSVQPAWSNAALGGYGDEVSDNRGANVRPSAKAPDSDGGLPIRLYFANNRFLLVNHEFFLDFKVEVLDATLHRLEVWWRDKDGEEPKLVKTCSVGSTHTFELGVRYVAKVAGFLRPKVFIVCHYDDCSVFYQTFDMWEMQTRVYKADEAPKNILTQYNQNISNTGNGSSVGNDNAFHVDVSMADNAHDAFSLITKLAEERPHYVCVKALQSFVPEGEPSYARQAVVPRKHDKLTLSIDGKLIHIVTRDVISFGRYYPRNDFAVGEVYSGTSAESNPNRTVSRSHLRIERIDDELTLHDQSSGGTLFNDTLLCEATGVRSVKISSEATLRMGNYSLDVVPQSCCPQRSALCRNCPRDCNNTSLLLKYTNRAEYYIIVWKCFDFSQLQIGLHNCVLRRRQDGFLLEQSDGTKSYLCPGLSVKIGDGNMALDVKEFYQPYGHRAESLLGGMYSPSYPRYRGQSRGGSDIIDKYYGH